LCNVAIQVVNIFFKGMQNNTVSKEELQKSKKELEELLNSLLESGKNFDSDIIEQIFALLDFINDQIEYDEFQSNAVEQQQSNSGSKVNEKDLYLHDVEIQRIYKENDGQEETVVCVGITGEVGLEGMFYNFVQNDDEKSKVYFVNENDHWITVRLQKTNNGITYQVADSLQSEGAKIRSEKIDELLNYKGIEKKPFKSMIQENSYDCGIYAALNAVDMGGYDVENNLTTAKSTFSQNNVNFQRKFITEERQSERQFEEDTKRAIALSNVEMSSNQQGSINFENIQLDSFSSIQKQDSNIKPQSRFQNVAQGQGGCGRQ